MYQGNGMLFGLEKQIVVNGCLENENFGSNYRKFLKFHL